MEELKIIFNKHILRILFNLIELLNLIKNNFRGFAFGINSIHNGTSFNESY